MMMVACPVARSSALPSNGCLLTSPKARVDIIVVYKVDRLTRSLPTSPSSLKRSTSRGQLRLDHPVFNTTTSMGRLTLNMLLSFAQFEREVTAERIRDKIAASKAKGMWMGGRPPIGYKARQAQPSAIVEEHAEMIRLIFKLYLALGNVRLLEEQLKRRRIHKPTRHTLDGRQFGGTEFKRGELYAILSNPIYIGKLRHHEVIYNGLHPADHRR